MAVDNSDIVLAAINAAGAADEPGWEQRVRTLTRRFTIALSDSSEFFKEVEVMRGIKPFLAILAGGRFEQASKRGIITFLSKANEVNAEGREEGRTERTDSEDGAATFNLAKSLKGHVVLVYIEHQSALIKGQQRTVRVIKHLADQGVATEADYERFGHQAPVVAAAETVAAA